jgi:hypothetical protein
MKKNIKDISEFGNILEFLNSLQVESFFYEKEEVKGYTPTHMTKELQNLEDKSSKYVETPKGIQLQISPSETLYPELMTTDFNEEPTVRLDLMIPLLLQGIKELNTKLSTLNKNE